ncbi:hypothetical protein INT43_008666 [Umbelopsis isabellina]|uniref:NmrA-like domain-containing protein n=1 Tax=Mortierella isabellina TaxID=91625 RepID=A0A8H7PX57_MORIS|nr:hypothetical protein INT43_008666 [Umbelopsis isabellina]
MIERVFVTGGAGNVGRKVVQELVDNYIQATVYTKDVAKAYDLFPYDCSLTFVEGDYNDMDAFAKAIVGHTRLFLLVVDVRRLADIKVQYAKIAYQAGVKQIVDISSNMVSKAWRYNFASAAQGPAERALVNLPDRAAYVTLRPSSFMTNHLYFDAVTLRQGSLVGIVAPNCKQEWISTNDIGLAAANILQEPIEKHANAVYDMIGDSVSSNERADIFSKVLEREIKYYQVRPLERYKLLNEHVKIPHSIAYAYCSRDTQRDVNIEIEILLGREPETLKQWITNNRHYFQ